MTDPKKYWIADVDGAKALVEGAEARDYWTKVQGWTETTEPTGQEFVWLRHNEHGGRAKYSAEAAPLFESRGWFPSDPPEPVNAATAHWPATEAPAAPQSAPAPTKPAASANSGDKKE